jgi:hypothetical protein
MIPRYQAILFIILLAASAVMGVVVWQLRERAHQRLVSIEDSAPTQAPEVAPAEDATLLVANDAENTLLPQVQSLPLPPDPGTRALVILGKLLDVYAAPDAAHPVPGGATSIAQVFLLPASNIKTAPGQDELSQSNSDKSISNAEAESKPAAGPELAVVNLTGAFAAGHPSGLETETLTVMSICGTLHANLPRITQVRFLVDGQPRATLAGHADLSRVYLTADAVPETEGARP